MCVVAIKPHVIFQAWLSILTSLPTLFRELLIFQMYTNFLTTLYMRGCEFYIHMYLSPFEEGFVERWSPVALLG